MDTFRIELVRESGACDVPREILSDSVGVARVLASEFEGLDREKFIVLLLDAKHRVIGVNTVSIGSLAASIVHPRLCFAKHKRGYVAATVMWRRARSTAANGRRDASRRHISRPVIAQVMRCSSLRKDSSPT